MLLLFRVDPHCERNLIKLIIFEQLARDSLAGQQIQFLIKATKKKKNMLKI